MLFGATKSKILLTLVGVTSCMCLVNLALFMGGNRVRLGGSTQRPGSDGEDSSKARLSNCSSIPDTINFLEVLGSLPAASIDKQQPMINFSRSKAPESTDTHVNLTFKQITWDTNKPLVTLEELPQSVFRVKNRCYNYFQEVQIKRVTKADVTNAKEHISTASGRCVCLVTHLTDSRFEKLQELADRWPGPISASIYSNENTDYKSLVKNITSWLRTVKRNNIAVHITISQGKYYPVNYLRNVAMNYSVCTYMFIADVDYMPNADLHDNLQKHILKNDISKKKIVLVVAAFEMLTEDAAVPRSKQQLLDQWDQGELKPFHQSRKTRNGHGATNYTRWVTANESYPISFKEGFEPYVLISRHVAPAFLDLFLHRYGNKVSYFVELNARGFTFEVLPHNFVVHTMHPSLDSKRVFTEVGPCTSLVFSKLKSKIKSLQNR